MPPLDYDPSPLSALPERILPGHMDINFAALENRLGDLARQDFLVTVQGWFLEHDELLRACAPSFFLDMTDQRVFLAEDEGVKHQGPEERDEEITQAIEAFSELLDGAVGDRNEATAHRVITAMNKHGWSRESYLSVLTTEAEKLLPGQGQAWLASFAAHAQALALADASPSAEPAPRPRM